VTAEEQRALLAVALLAAFADGDNSDAEREEVRRIATTLGGLAAGLNIPALMQDVLLKRLGPTEVVAALKAPDHRQLAYELAVCMRRRRHADSGRAPVSGPPEGRTR
jgi:DnaJ-domain-containing protein 1